MTPVCIKALYKIPNATKACKGNSLGLYEQGDYFAKSDLDLFYKDFAPWVPQGTYPTPNLIDGANFSVPAYSSLNTGESDIDIDMVYVEHNDPQFISLADKC
jgi:tripeptidyl-peptidase-1